MASLSTSELKKSVAAVLKGADLTTLSSKKVRKKLEEQYDTDFNDRKEEIDRIVMAMVTAEQNDKDSDDEEAESGGEKSDQGSSPQNSESEEEKKFSPKKSKLAAKRKYIEETNDMKDESHSESEDEVEDKRPPPKKSKPAAKSKPKKEAKNDAKSNSDSDKSDDDVDDEALARKLQEEERNSRSRAVKKNFNKKEPVKKSNKSKSNGKPRKESVYSRKCALSADLANVVGASEMARHDIVKKMWSVVRERNLFDPKNKRFALCDEQLQKVFGAKRILMFGMMKYLKNHIKDQH